MMGFPDGSPLAAAVRADVIAAKPEINAAVVKRMLRNLEIECSDRVRLRCEVNGALLQSTAKRNDCSKERHACSAYRFTVPLKA
jgi:hypothetical protein